MTKEKTYDDMMEEKRLNYLRTQKENVRRKREERKKEAEEGRENERRLAFMVNIIRTLGYDLKTVARKSGIPSQTIYWYTATADDCHLSAAEQIMTSIGIKLGVKMEKKTETAPILVEDTKKSNGVGIRIEGVLPTKEAKKTPSYLDKVTPENRLYFIKEIIQDSNMVLSHFAKRCGMDPTSLRYYFDKDDMNISILYKIAQGMNMNIVWTIEPLEKKTDD